MRLVFTSIALAAASLSATAVPAFTQTAGAAIAPGMQVVDTAGAAVGTVVAVKDEYLTIKTDRHQADLGKDSFTPHEGKLLFGMTQAELNAAVDKDIAAAEAALVAGATVKSADGTDVGIIDAIDSETATIKLASGNAVRIERSGIRGSPSGHAVIGVTADQLQAQLPAAAFTGDPAESASDGGSTQ